MDTDLDLGRYASGLRRHKSVILAIALLSLVAGLVGAFLSPTTATTQLRAFPKLLEFDSIGLDSSQLDVDKVVDVLAATANEKAFEEAISDAVGADVEVSARRDLERPMIALTISASSATDIEEADTVVTEQLRSRFAEEFGTDIARVRTGTDLRRSLVEGQLAEVDAKLAAAGGDQQTLVEGLLVERQRLTEQVATFEVTLSVLDRFEESLPRDLRRTTLTEPDKRSPLLLGALALIAGTVLAVLAVLARVATDRSLRTRRDLDRLGLHDLVGVVPTERWSTAVVAARKAIEHTAAHHGVSAAQIVPVRAATDLSWAADLGSDGRCRFEPQPSLAESPDAIVGADEHTITVLAVAWGRDRREEVVRVANEFAAAGSAHVAVVLCGVPPKETAGVET